MNGMDRCMGWDNWIGHCDGTMDGVSEVDRPMRGKDGDGGDNWIGQCDGWTIRSGTAFIHVSLWPGAEPCVVRRETCLHSLRFVLGKLWGIVGIP